MLKGDIIIPKYTLFDMNRFRKTGESENRLGAISENQSEPSYET